MAITGFILGIVSGLWAILFGTLLPFLGLCIAAPAVVFSAIGLKDKDKRQLCVCGLAFGAITSIFFTVYFTKEMLDLIKLLLELANFE